METFRIVSVVGSEFMNKHPEFKGKRRHVIADELTYEEAEDVLLEIYNGNFGFKRGYVLDLREAYEQSYDKEFGVNFDMETVITKKYIYYIDHVDIDEPTNYAIIGRTNGYIAQRDGMFKGKTEIIIDKNLTFGDAESRLMEMYNEYYAEKLGYSWTLLDARMAHGENSYIDRDLNGFEYDSRKFTIEQIEE